MELSQMFRILCKNHWNVLVSVTIWRHVSLHTRGILFKDNIKRCAMFCWCRIIHTWWNSYCTFHYCSLLYKEGVVKAVVLLKCTFFFWKSWSSNIPWSEAALKKVGKWGGTPAMMANPKLLQPLTKSILNFKEKVLAN